MRQKLSKIHVRNSDADMIEIRSNMAPKWDLKPIKKWFQHKFEKIVILVLIWGSLFGLFP